MLSSKIKAFKPIFLSKYTIVRQSQILLSEIWNFCYQTYGTASMISIWYHKLSLSVSMINIWHYWKERESSICPNMLTSNAVLPKCFPLRKKLIQEYALNGLKLMPSISPGKIKVKCLFKLPKKPGIMKILCRHKMNTNFKLCCSLLIHTVFCIRCSLLIANVLRNQGCKKMT